MKTITVLLLGGPLVSVALAQPLEASLRAGAAKVDITPPQSAMKFPTDIIRDHLFVRAIVVDDGRTCGVIVGMDINGPRGSMVQDAVSRSRRSSGCPAENYLITGARGHSSSTLGLSGGLPDDAQVTDAIVKAIEAAKGRLEPARVGFGTTTLPLNVNRDLYEGGRWYQGPNPTGSTDKTLAVLSFVGNDNLPIAVVMNYSMHVINFYLSGVLSADYPGAASRWVERRFAERPVAIFTQGAAADQNQRFHDLSYKLAGFRTHNEAAQRDWIIGPSVWKAESQAFNADADSLAGLEKPLQPPEMTGYQAAYELTSELVSAIGVMIGESAIEVMKTGPEHYAAAARIHGAQDVFTCPGRERLTQPGVTPPREGVPAAFKNAPPVQIKVGLLRIGDISLVYVNGDLYSQIGLRIKAVSPASKTMVVSIANSAGPLNTVYMPADEAYTHLTFQMLGSRMEPGCAEDGIVGASLKLLHGAP
jgi:hypothetical protein